MVNITDAAKGGGSDFHRYADFAGGEECYYSGEINNTVLYKAPEPSAKFGVAEVTIPVIAVYEHYGEGGGNYLCLFEVESRQELGEFGVLSG